MSDTQSYIVAAQFMYDLCWKSGDFHANETIRNVFNHLLDRAIANTHLGRRLNV